MWNDDEIEGDITQNTGFRDLGELLDDPDYQAAIRADILVAEAQAKAAVYDEKLITRRRRRGNSFPSDDGSHD